MLLHILQEEELIVLKNVIITIFVGFAKESRTSFGFNQDPPMEIKHQPPWRVELILEAK
jgi:hypothetical protein